jgi:transposase
VKKSHRWRDLRLPTDPAAPTLFAMSEDMLFPDLSPAPPSDDAGPARYETANRSQVELTPCDLEGLLPPGHAARLVWRFVEGLDLSAFYAAIRAREGRPGRPPIDPKILIALWLYATIDGVGSAREVDRLCRAHDAYRWLRGGVSVNYHTLSDVRVQHQAALDQLLTQSITMLLHRGIVTLARVAHDGTRIRASAGVGSFRRGASLRECQTAARKQVERTARQPAGGARSREEAAQARAAREREALVDEAVRQLPEVQAAKDRNTPRGQWRREARVSTTDPDVRIMKLADGGFRPAYNVQLATDMDSRVIVGVTVTNQPSDQGAFVPMLAQIQQRTTRLPQAGLIDAGINTNATVTAAAADGVTIYAPVPARRGVTDPAARCADDSDAVAAWRQRMATDEAKGIYRQRGAVAEWVNADLRTHRTLGRVLVRRLAKVHTWALWAALAHNMLRTLAIVPHLTT